MKHAEGATGAVYGLGFIGALIYFIQHATSFGIGLLGVLKALRLASPPRLQSTRTS